MRATVTMHAPSSNMQRFSKKLMTIFTVGSQQFSQFDRNDYHILITTIISFWLQRLSQFDHNDYPNLTATIITFWSQRFSHIDHNDYHILIKRIIPIWSQQSSHFDHSDFHNRIVMIFTVGSQLACSAAGGLQVVSGVWADSHPAWLGRCNHSSMYVPHEYLFLNCSSARHTSAFTGWPIQVVMHGMCHIFESDTQIRCINSMHESNAWIKCMTQMHEFDAWIICMKQMHDSDAWLKCMTQMHEFDAWLRWYFPFIIAWWNLRVWNRRLPKCHHSRMTTHGWRKSRVHAASELAFAPSLATVKLNCYGYYI